MKAMKDLPKVLYRKILFTALIGIGVFLAGGAYFFFSWDKITLALSGAILVFSLARAYSIYNSARGGKYEVVEGTCVAVKVKPMRKHVAVRIMDDTGIESTLRLGKQARVKVGFRYRFYFTHTQDVSLGSEYLDAALSHGGFLGFEELGEFTDAG